MGHGHRAARPDAGDGDQPGQHLAHGHRHAGERRGCADQRRIFVGFTVSGVNPTTGTSTTNVPGVATFSYTGTNAGTDQIAACYNADARDPVRPRASATKTWTGVTPVDRTLTVNITGSGSVTSNPTGIARPGTAPRPSTTVGRRADAGAERRGSCSPAGPGRARARGLQRDDERRPDRRRTFTPVAVTRTLNVTVNGAGSVTLRPGRHRLPGEPAAHRSPTARRSR